MLSALISRLTDPERWLFALARDQGAVDRAFNWAEARQRARQLAVSMDTPKPKPAVPPGSFWERIRSDPSASADDTVLFLSELAQRAEDEMSRALISLPRGRERSLKWPCLAHGHALRTRRVVEHELRLEWRNDRRMAPPVDYGDRLQGEEYALRAELSAERHCESYAPLTESEMRDKSQRLDAIREIIGVDHPRKEINRRRTARPTSDGGNLAAPQRSAADSLGL